MKLLGHIRSSLRNRPSRRMRICRSLPILFGLSLSPLSGFCGQVASVRATDFWQPFQPGIEELLANGKTAEAERRLQNEAAEAEKKFGKEDPRILESLESLARLSLAGGDKKRIEGIVSRISRLQPWNWQVYVDMGLLHEEMGDHEKAIGFLDGAVALKPEDYKVYLALGQIYRMQEKWSLSIKMLGLAKDFCPRCADIYLNLGYTDLAAGRDQEALKQFEELRKLDPASFRGYHHLGAYYQLKGKYGIAEKFFKQALALLGDGATPDWDMYHASSHLADIYISEGRYAEAEALYLRLCSALEKSPDPGWRSLLLLKTADFYRTMKRFDQAEIFYRRAAAAFDEKSIGDNENDYTAVEPLVSLADICLLRGGKSEARSYCERARLLLKKMPHYSNLPLLCRLSELYAAWGQGVQADEIAGQALFAMDYALPNPKTKIDALKSLIKIYEGLGKMSESRSLAQRVETLEKDGPQ